MQLHKLACSYISLHAVSWACILHAVPFFVWAAHKNFAVLVFDVCFPKGTYKYYHMLYQVSRGEVEGGSSDGWWKPKIEYSWPGPGPELDNPERWLPTVTGCNFPFRGATVLGPCSWQEHLTSDGLGLWNFMGYLTKMFRFHRLCIPSLASWLSELRQRIWDVI